MSQILPKELLKFRLDKQLARLRQLFTLNEEKKNNDFLNYYQNSEENGLFEEDNFQLYQRILSWFIMGRLAKMEYDGILEKLLLNSEFIELHNRVIELLRAIYCDSTCSNQTRIEKDSENILNSFEFNLLPPEELEGKINFEIEDNETEIEDLNIEIPPFISSSTSKYIIESKITNTNTNIKTKTKTRIRRRTKGFKTSVNNLALTPSEEALISEALRNPIHDICIDRDVLIPGVNFRSNEIFGDRLCTQILSLPHQNLMKKRFTKIGLEYLKEDSEIFNVDFNFNSSLDQDGQDILIKMCPDPIAVLACKSLEDYMKNLLENMATLKGGNESLLRPPISYIFPEYFDDFTGAETEPAGYVSNKSTGNEILKITDMDLNLLFRLKPWLLADMEYDIILSEE